MKVRKDMKIKIDITKEYFLNCDYSEKMLVQKVVEDLLIGGELHNAKFKENVCFEIEVTPSKGVGVYMVKSSYGEAPSKPHSKLVH